MQRENVQGDVPFPLQSVSSFLISAAGMLTLPDQELSEVKESPQWRKQLNTFKKKKKKNPTLVI